MQKIANKIWSLINNIACCIIKWICELFNKELSDEQLEAFQQFLKFALVGVSNTIVSYLLYSGSLLCFHKLDILKGYDYLTANIISFVLSVLWSFYWNNKMVFVKKEGEGRSIFKALLKTYASYAFTGLILNSFLLVLWIDICHISEFIAPIINCIIGLPINFLLNKLWAFKG